MVHVLVGNTVLAGRLNDPHIDKVPCHARFDKEPLQGYDVTGQARGTQRDRAVRDWYAEHDWFAVCARGSHGCADVLAIKLGHRPHVVQVKSTAGGPWERFGPRDRAELAAAAALGGADAFLAHWPSRGRLRFYAENEWP
jgi:hypothetical protein